MIYELRIYEADDSTVLATLTTDPLGAHPHLKVPDSMSEAMIDFLKGSSTIGQINVDVVDVPTDPADQATGYFTSLLPDAEGESALNGHRAELLADPAGLELPVLDGVIWHIELTKLTTYTLQLRDIREREREHPLFETTDTPTVVPRGVLDGYGVPYPGAPSNEWLIPPTEGVLARYRERDGFSGNLEFTASPRLALSDEQMAALKSTSSFGFTELHPLRRDRINIMWRPAAGGSWNTIVHPLAGGLPGLTQLIGLRPLVVGSGRVTLQNGDRVEVPMLEALGFAKPLSDTTDLPDDGASVEVIIQYNGPTTEYWPRHIEGITEGEFLEGCYDGTYSPASPRVRYDETAVLAQERPMRARITAPVEDMRPWLEKEYFSPRGGAPAIVAGVVTPAFYETPAADEEFPQLDDTNCEPLPGWSTGVDSTINSVSVTYYRDMAADESEVGQGDGDRIVSREITVRREDEGSILLNGPQPLKIKTSLFRAVGGKQGEPASGDVTDEVGHQLALERAYQALSRFRKGGQIIAANALRTDSDVEALKPGDWVYAAASWWPDYGTGERGANRIAQVVSRRNVSATLTSLMLEDAGPALTPVGQPTVGTLAVTDSGQVEVPVTSLPSGVSARVDFAVSETSPAQSSPLWMFAARTDEEESVYTPQLRAGADVWIRYRGEANGRRPSAWSTPATIEIPAAARVRGLRLAFLDDGTPVVRGSANQNAPGVRIYWEIHQRDEDAPDPLTESQDFDGSLDEWELTDATVYFGKRITLEVEGWTEFADDEVDGTAGERIRLTGVIPIPEDVPFGSLQAAYSDANAAVEFFAQGNRLAKSFAWAIRVGTPPDAPDDASADETGTVDEAYGDVSQALASPGSDPVYLGVWFYSAPGQEGVEGPRALIRARRIAAPSAALAPAVEVSAEWTRGEGSGLLTDRQIALGIGLRSDVRSLRITYQPESEPTGTEISGAQDVDVDGSSFSSVGRIVRNSSDVVVDFPQEYDADTQVVVDAYDAIGGQAGAGTLLGSARARLLYQPGLNPVVASNGLLVPVGETWIL